ncbi:hypothetical protein L0244_37675 [bacterium]|nr:hypothetical protein [bacterium]
MRTAQEVEKAVSKLPPHELVRFRAWFEQFDAEMWDKQFENDATSGKLDKIAERAIADYKAGKAKDL